MASGLGLSLFLFLVLRPQTDHTGEVQRLIDQLGSPRFAERAAATQRLEEFGRVALPGLREALKSLDPEVRERARSVIQSLCCVPTTSLTYASESNDAGRVVFRVAFSPDGRLLAAAGDQGVRLWEAGTCKQLATLGSRSERMRCLAFDADSAMLVATGEKGFLESWGVQSLAPQTKLPLQKHPPYTLELSPNGQVLAWISYRDMRRVKVWHFAAKKPPYTFVLPPELEVRCLKFSCDGALLAAGGWNCVHVRDATTGEAERTLRWDDVTPREVLALAFSADAGVLACSGCVSDDPNEKPQLPDIRLWDVKTGKPRGLFRRCCRSLFCLSFSPDGRTLAAAGEENGVRLFDVPSGVELTLLEGQGDIIRDVTFSNDGRMLAAASGDGAVLLWDLSKRFPTSEKPRQASSR
jgi:WD40 repeat protein